MAKEVKRKCPQCGEIKSFRKDQKSCGCKPPKPEPPETSEIQGDNWTISLPKTRIHTLDQLVEYCKIDLETWLIDRWICNKWEVGAKNANDELVVEPLYQVKAFLKRKVHVADARAEIDRLREEAKKYSPKFPTIRIPEKKSDVVQEFSIYDHHFGSLIWGKETLSADYDIRIARDCYEKALTALIRRGRAFNPSKALLILGNDQQNADNRQGTTEKGTPQNMDSRYQKVFSISRDVSRWAIDVLLGEFGAVDVVPVSGNHDPLSTWHLGDTLSSWYRNCKQVFINNSPAYRKYYEHGVNMLLFTHGNAGKLEEYDKTMAAEMPEMWGRTKWREAHTGDKHHRRLIELKGATIRILPSLRPPDAWTSENHYIGSLRAAESYMWDRNEGLVGTATYSVLGDKQ